MTEFDQLEESLLFGCPDETDEWTTIDPESLTKLKEDYETFCSTIPDWLDIEDACLVSVMGDAFTQCAHDYVMTRMRHGVGFWEEDDWDKAAGIALTERCRLQGDLETYAEDGVLYII